MRPAGDGRHPPALTGEAPASAAFSEIWSSPRKDTDSSPRTWGTSSAEAEAERP